MGSVVGPVRVAAAGYDTPEVESLASSTPRGLALSTMDNPAVLDAPPEWGEAVPLSTVARASRVSAQQLHHAINRGHLHPVARPGQGQPVLLSRDESIAVLTAAALSLAAGLVFGSALRAVLAGATFPLPEVAA